MKVLIVEDEHYAAQKLISLIHQYDSDIAIIDTLDTVEDSIEWFNNNSHPDLVFMDIHLADGSSFEIFEHATVKSPIIFTTAYDQYAIQAFKTNSVDYLLKPITSEDLKGAIDKFHQLFDRSDAPNYSTEFQVLTKMIQIHQKPYKMRFLVKAGNLIKSISISDIAYFIFEDRMTMLMTHEGRRFPTKYTLDELENLLDPQQYRRANRQFIISIDAISKIHPWFKGRLKLDLSPPQNSDLVISAEKTKEFKEWLDR